MVVKRDHQVMLTKLKKQVRLLQSKEAQAKTKLKSALIQLRKLGIAYKSKFAAKVRDMNGKIAEAEVTGFIKAAQEIERQVLHGIERKGKALASAILKVEKKHVVKKKVAKKK